MSNPPDYNPFDDGNTEEEDDRAREAALLAMSDKIRRRLKTPREEFVDAEAVFGKARAPIREARKHSSAPPMNRPPPPSGG